ncbi:MAG TPA: hypothetical protein VMT91_11830, partial [Anaerolineales bacterium]|nr:hypothetical protein [Anaerolineales bacterium]
MGFKQIQEPYFDAFIQKSKSIRVYQWKKKQFLNSLYTISGILRMRGSVKKSLSSWLGLENSETMAP